MITYDDVTKENINHQNLNQSQIPDHIYRLLVTGGFGFGKTNALLKMVKHQDDDNYSFINKIYLYVKDLNEAKY